MHEQENALGEFLRARRRLVSPDDRGLHSEGRRRVTGLRRDELAFLAGVSAHYYARLEQGRALHPSTAVLDSLARVLGLGEEARKHLRELAEGATMRPRQPRAAETVSPGLLELLDGWSQQPVAIVGRYRDVLFSNSLTQALTSSFQPGKNLLREVFLDAPSRSFYIDWEQVACGAVAGLRSTAGRDLSDPHLRDLVDELSAHSDEFRRIWSRHDVLEKTSGIKRYFVPLVGQLVLNYHTFQIKETPDQTLFVFSAAAGSRDESALRLLRQLIEPAPASHRTSAPPRLVTHGAS